MCGVGVAVDEASPGGGLTGVPDVADGLALGLASGAGAAGVAAAALGGAAETDGAGVGVAGGGGFSLHYVPALKRGEGEELRRELLALS